jgi:hypothetical protein
MDTTVIKPNTTTVIKPNTTTVIKPNTTTVIKPNTTANADTTTANADTTTAKEDITVVEGYIMDEKVNISNLIVKKKRGRRRKIDISDNFYNNEYITVWSEIIDGKKLLIDNDNNVYTFNLSSPEYLGKKTLSCKIVKP